MAAQRAITDMRRRVEEHVARLPVRYFDSTQTGVLISRIMTDAEGIRNLVGTGLVQLIGSVVTAVARAGVALLPQLAADAVTLVVLGAFGGAMSYAFKTLRPLFRERGKINAEVTGRLNQTLGGVRIVKTYTAEQREELVFTEGRAPAVPQRRPVDDRRLGDHGVLERSSSAHRRDHHSSSAAARSSTGRMTVGEFSHYIVFTGLHGGADRPDRVDRHADQRGVRGPRSHPRDS